MSALRILHQVARDEGDDALLLAYVGRARDAAGCLDAELYRSLEYPENAVVTTSWRDEHAFRSHWLAMLESGWNPEVLYEANALRRYGSDGTEIYHLARFARVENGFVPIEASPERSVIQWPGGGPIRILVFGAHSDLEGRRASMLENAKGTRRQPGCPHFEHFSGVEFPEHTLLVELWSDAHAFEAHLFYPRLSLGGPPAAQPVSRRHGTNGLEFYRYRPFVHLFGQWVAPELSDRSDHVIWPD